MTLLSIIVLSACTRPDSTAVCPPRPVLPGEVRVRRLGCEADLPTGPFVAARVGDWVLENAHSRWVVRDGSEGHALVGLTGGNLVDAVRTVGGRQLGGDGLRELASAVGFHMLAPTGFVAGPDNLSVDGELVAFPLVTDVLSVPRPSATVRWNYRLEPDSPVLELQAELDGPEASLAELVLVRGGQQLFVPGTDPWDLPLTTDAGAVGLWSADPELGPAMATSSDTGRTLLFAGPIRVVLYEPRDGQVTRRVALGADHAEASAWLDPELEVWDNDEGLVEVHDVAGLPVSRCRSARCAVPSGAAELVPVWIGDGNGGPGGPGQEGQPALLQVTAPGAFRASAIRSDGLERFGIDTDGDATFSLPAGEWQVWVTAGPTHTWHTEAVTLVAGEQARIDADLRQVVDTSGWSAADLHVHMETSLDSDITVDHRLRTALAEGLDYVVTTDHDFVATPDAPEGLAVRAAAEVSTMSAGHYNTWPVSTDPDVAGNGASDWRGLSAQQLLDVLPGLVQCNHPRFVDGGYAASFEVGVAPEQCDLVEVLNGFSAAETPAVLQDLLGSWDAGHRPAATGTSDTHYEDDMVGNPRTWIHAEGDVDRLDDALAEGLAVASGGPFVTLSLQSGGDSAGIGETLSPTGAVSASIDLQAPEWMNLAELVLVVDGVEVWSTDLSGLAATDGLKRYQGEVDVAPSGYVVVIHRGAAASFPATHAPPDVVSNPVWIQ